MTEHALRLAKLSPDLRFYSHQRDGIEWMCRRNSFILADDMGLGKSVQALACAAVDFHRGTAHRILIVAPASLKWNWLAEIEERTLFTATVLDGTKAKREDQLAAFDADILIVNYEQVTGHLDTLNGLGFDIAIYDEAHALKNPRAKRTIACQALRADRHFLLTGSPMLNQVDELWSLLHRVDPHRWPRYWAFISKHAVYGGYKDKQIVGVKSEGKLHAELHDVMLRRLKRDVLDLPDKQIIPVWVELTPTQRKLYTQARDELQIDLPDSPSPMELENALVKFLRLKMICGSSGTIEGYDDHSQKLDRAVEMVTEMYERGEKVVVFTQFREVQRLFIDRLMAAKIETVYQLNGGVPTDRRVPVVQEWAADPKPNPIVCMLQVAGVGLNMTAASTAIFLDKLFVPKLNEQAEDRIHRIGADKTHPVQIYHLLTRNTVEERVERILKKKSELFQTLVENDPWRQKLIAALIEEES